MYWAGWSLSAALTGRAAATFPCTSFSKALRVSSVVCKIQTEFTAGKCFEGTYFFNFLLIWFYQLRVAGTILLNHSLKRGVDYLVLTLSHSSNGIVLYLPSWVQLQRNNCLGILFKRGGGGGGGGGKDTWIRMCII